MKLTISLTVRSGGYLLACRRALVLAASLLMAAGLMSAPNFARAEFPDHPITLVVPYGAGASIDAVARSLAQGAQKRLGQSVVVENRTGAGGALGATYVGRKPADGYTIAIVSNNPFVLGRFSNSMQMDPVTDFTHIITVTGSLVAVAVRTDSKIKNIKELLEAARKEPGKLTYSTSGTASTGFLNMEEFAALANIKVQHVPYKSGAEAVTAILSGQVDFYSDAAWGPFARDGRLRPLLLIADKRISQYPDVPIPTDIVSAQVHPGEFLLVGPKGLQPAVLQRLHDAFKETLSDPEFLKMQNNFNMNPVYRGPEATRDAIATLVPPLQKMFNTLNLGVQ